MTKEEIWEAWGAVHDTADAQKRIVSASKAANTPLIINEADLYGRFSGSSGEYKTTLSSCTCIDFSKRKLPCKHIYRLAMELKLIDTAYQSDSSKRKRPKNRHGLNFLQAVQVIESFTDNEQKLLYDVLLNIKKGVYEIGLISSPESDSLINKGILEERKNKKMLLEPYGRNELNAKILALDIPFNKNMKKERLIQWCIDNIPDKIDDIAADAVVVSLSNEFDIARGKLTTYLKRKYFWIETPESQECINGEFYGYYDGEMPEDEITELLRKNGHRK